MRSRPHRLAAGEEGFTLVEILVAIIVLASAALGAAQVLTGSVRTQYRAEQTQVAIDRAQAELEAIRTLSYAEVGLSTAPPATPAGGPGDRLTGSCAAQGVSTDGCFGLNDNGSNLAPLVVENGALESGETVTGAGVDPGPTTFTSGDVSGAIYRYVVWQNDPSCAESQCPGSQDRKRVAVVVTINDTASGGVRTYREVQSDLIDPELGREVPPQPSPSGETTAQQLFLTDTTCDQSSRVMPTADHPFHNTLGDCSGANPPDLLATDPPDLDPAFPPEQQPEYDFASDIEPTTGAGADKGLQVRRDESSGCNYAPPGSASAQKTHRWVSPAIEPGSTYVLEGDPTLELFTQTLNGVVAGGAICAFLFVREPTAGGGWVDTMIGDADNGGAPYFSYSDAAWPAGGWDAIRVPMALEPPAGESVIRVDPGERLGLALTVKLSSAVDALQFAYEHADYASRLEVVTATPLP